MMAPKNFRSVSKLLMSFTNIYSVKSGFLNHLAAGQALFFALKETVSQKVKIHCKSLMCFAAKLSTNLCAQQHLNLLNQLNPPKNTWDHSPNKFVERNIRKKVNICRTVHNLADFNWRNCWNYENYEICDNFVENEKWKIHGENMENIKDFQVI